MIVLRHDGELRQSHEIEHGDVPSPSGVDKGDVEAAFWGKRGREFGPSFEAQNFVSLMDKVEAYIYFYHHGVNATRDGAKISDYLLDRVDKSLTTYNDGIRSAVYKIICEAQGLYEA
jgi:hypothetical protein